ncbi:hypothetical protein B0H66DRAFT_546532 [Apodospora peruviana]|uniref:Uncharacterized protein n=1 Tax=Apodospora peruviana TaxID=516989 RepID=A0AAE0IUJ3_9PEZI|nr:hypothetical protein B0H66DRAFT_546532 [Apodospora peruviana]
MTNKSGSPVYSPLGSTSQRSSAPSENYSTTPSRSTLDRWTPSSSLRPTTTHDGDVAFESDTASLPIFTPASSSVFTFSGSPHSDSQYRFQGIPMSDIPIPSVENGASATASSPSRSQYHTPVSSSHLPSARSPTPSIAVSPAPVSSAAPAPQSSSVSFNGIDTDIQRMHLSWPGDSLDMSGLAAALPRNYTLEASPAPLRPPTAQHESESPRPSPARSRRSSSRVNSLRHNVRDEEPPQDRFHEPAFQQAFHNAKALMGDLARVLESSSLHLGPDSTMRSLRQTAQELATFRCPPTRVVGLVGDSGVGKSSLLNSLLDVRGLARVSNIGAACTCVVTEYRYHESENFAINVEEFSIDELKRQFTEMISNYRHHHFHSAEIDDDGERRDSDNLAKLALDTFSVMFRGRFDIALLTSGRQDVVLETLLRWARERNPVARQSIVNTAEECSTKLMHLTSEEASPQGPAAWPYIKKISVSLNAHILSKGLVLVDLPGLRDLNSARLSITERYLLNCDEIFAVCSIGRATTDEGVMGVFGLARQARLSKVGIICTRSDDIRAEEAKKDWRGERAMRIQELMTTINLAERSLADMGRRLAELEDFGDDLFDGEQDEKIKLYRDIERQRVTVEDEKLALQNYLIVERNALVTTELTEKYRPQVPGGNISVFCASNTIYWDNRNKTPAERAMPFLRLSGILEIRRHCIALVSESQLRIAVHYMQDKLPNFISRIELWVQSGAGTTDAEQKQAVRAALNQLEASLRQKFRGRASPTYGLSNVLANDFHENIYQRRNINGWTQGAINAGHQWDTLSHQTYAAFCRAYGIHTTGVAGYHNWNEEAIETMVREISDPWNAFELVLDNRFTHITTSINDALDSASDHLANLPDSYDSSILPLHHALTSCQRLLWTEVEDLCDGFGGRVSELRTDALSGLRTAFFAQSMEEAYAGAKRMSGRGCTVRKQSIINGRLAQQEQFRSLMQRFRNEFRSLSTKLETDIQNKLNKRLDIITEILDIIRSDNVAEESERDPEFRARVDGEIQNVKTAMQEVLAVVRGNEE